MLNVFNFRNFSSQTGFEEAQKKLKTLSEDPGADIKLKIYALFKQVTFSNSYLCAKIFVIKF